MISSDSHRESFGGPSHGEGDDSKRKNTTPQLLFIIALQRDSQTPGSDRPSNTKSNHNIARIVDWGPPQSMF
jgi:hypothetical protein